MNDANQRKLTIIDEFSVKIKNEQRNALMIRWAPVIVLGVLIITFMIILGSSFVSSYNLRVILNQLAIPMLVACGLTFVVILGSIDLSIDGTVGMAASLFSIWVLNSKNIINMGFFGIFLAVLASVMVGFSIGIINVKLKIPSFIVSFGFLYISKGIGILSYGGIPAQIKDPILVKLPKVTFAAIPFITWIAIIMFCVSYFIQEYTSFGRHIFAVGTDENIPRNVGINVDRVKIMVFTYAGLLFGLAGILSGIRLGQGQVQAGENLMFPALTAVVVGGTSLSGGKGGVVNTLVGVMIIVILNNGLQLLGVNPYIKTGVQGLIVLIAVALTISHGHKVISK